MSSYTNNNTARQRQTLLPTVFTTNTTDWADLKVSREKAELEDRVGHIRPVLVTDTWSGQSTQSLSCREETVTLSVRSLIS